MNHRELLGETAGTYHSTAPATEVMGFNKGVDRQELAATGLSRALLSTANPFGAVPNRAMTSFHFGGFRHDLYARKCENTGHFDSC